MTRGKHKKEQGKTKPKNNTNTKQQQQNIKTKKLWKYLQCYPSYPELNIAFILIQIWVGGRGLFLPLCQFFLNNSETVKAANLALCSIQFLLETFLPNLASLTCPSLQILDEIQNAELEPQHNDENDFASLQSGEIYSEEIESLPRNQNQSIQSILRI